jgi:hypothetical protein
MLGYDDDAALDKAVAPWHSKYLRITTSQAPAPIVAVGDGGKLLMPVPYFLFSDATASRRLEILI